MADIENLNEIPQAAMDFNDFLHNLGNQQLGHLAMGITFFQNTIDDIALYDERVKLKTEKFDEAIRTGRTAGFTAEEVLETKAAAIERLTEAKSLAQENLDQGKVIFRFNWMAPLNPLIPYEEFLGENMADPTSIVNAIEDMALGYGGTITYQSQDKVSQSLNAAEKVYQIEFYF